MLSQIAIRDIVLIDKLVLDLGPGLTTMTGETGAGKSILLDALSLALGARGDGALVRQGRPQGQVTAAFALASDHPACAAAQNAGLPCEGDLILRRIQFADGRTRAYVNDESVSVQTLRTIGAELVEIHGQHDDRALVDSASHRRLVDAFGALAPLAEATRGAFARLRSIRQLLAAEIDRLEKLRSEADFLIHAHAELAKLGAKPLEEAALADRRAAMMRAEKVAAELRDAGDLLSGDHSPGATLRALARRLARRKPEAPDVIGQALAPIDAAIDAVESAMQVVLRINEEGRFDPQELERVEERLFALRAAGRKYGAPPDELGEVAAKIAADLATIDASEAKRVALARETGEAQASYRSAASSLSEARRAAAAALTERVNAELPPLRLEGARFQVALETDSAIESADGFDRVSFWVQTNPGTRAGPLMKVASGGELARFMLALKVALADRGSAPTLVFDEIDAGLGGAVAAAIGQRLASLASRAQVLAVTHAPQVAARARHHFRIVKDAAVEGDEIATRVLILHAESRREEIARMLAGARVTEEARAAARRLLEAD